MTCASDLDLEDLIRMELSAGENADCSNVVDSGLPVWMLVNDCMDTEMKYYMVMREGLKALMTCLAYKIDISGSVGEQDSAYAGSSAAVGNSQTQQTNSSVARSDSIGTSKYDDFATGAMDSRTERHAWSWSKDDETRKYDDVGSGSSESYTLRETKSCNVGQVRRGERSKSNSVGRGGRSGCDYSYSANTSKGATAGASLIFVNGSGSSTGASSTWDRFMSHEESMNQVDTASSASNNSVLGRNKQDSVTNRDSGSYFGAEVDQHNEGESNSKAHDESHSLRTEVAHAEGFGQAQSAADSDGSSSMQGTASSKDHAESIREAWRSGFSTSERERLSQHFKHIRYLYDNNEQMISNARKRNKGSLEPYTLEFQDKLNKYADCCVKRCQPHQYNYVY